MVMISSDGKRLEELADGLIYVRSWMTDFKEGQKVRSWMGYNKNKA